MTIAAATPIARVLKQQGVAWVSTFPFCRANNVLERGAVDDDFVRDACIIAPNRRAGPEYRTGSRITQGGMKQ